MSVQNYNHHKKYYPLHHFVFYPAMLICMAFSLRQFLQTNDMLWMMLALLFCSVIVLSYMLRQHYSLTNQNRIVRVELRLRYYLLTHKNLELLEDRLSFQQWAAIRFAPDNQFEELIENAIKSNLSADEIKKSIREWKPDNMRV